MPYTTITAVWTGFTGSPGYSKFRFQAELDSAGAEAAAGRVRTFFAAFQAHLAPGVVITIQPPAQIFDDQQQLTSEVDFTAPATVSSSNNQAYAGASGAHVNWHTGQVFLGRRVRGRTFLVPLSSTAFDQGGTLTTTALQLIRDAAAALVAGDPPLAIVGGTPGEATYNYSVTSSNVPDKAAVLRSRRD